MARVLLIETIIVEVLDLQRNVMMFIQNELVREKLTWTSFQSYTYHTLNVMQYNSNQASLCKYDLPVMHESVFCSLH